MKERPGPIARGGETLLTTDALQSNPVRAAASSPEDSEPKPGDRLGRYELTERIGAGGMGVVWAARDPALDRIVAVKILRMPAGNTYGDLRLRREGQTMARLTHPNVIRVYDVGFASGQLFIAMEYIAGGTVDDWLSRAPRTPEQILAVFAQAGRGLAAAHDAGLVHRDVKPSNMLVSDDGRVLVTDFGLARPSRSSEPAVAHGEPPARGLLATITCDGTLLGTPAFMAPEQHAGAPVDARADQFAFCVALWRALCGQPPYPGEAAPELAAAIRAGAIAAPPASAKLAPHVRAALVRGLAAAPEARFPSMRALLTALEPRRRRRLRVLAAGAAIAAIAGATALAERGRDHGDPCAAATDRFAGVWDAGVARRVASAFIASGVAYARASYDEVARALADRRASWEAMRRASCVATRVRGEQSDAMMDTRARCLDQRLADLAAFTALLQRADAAMVGQATQSAATVGDVTACGDVVALAHRMPPPDDPARRGELAAIERDLADVRARVAAGRWVDLEPSAGALVARARAADYPPVTGAALAVAADVATHLDHLAAAEHMLDEAVLAAEAGADDDLRFECEAALVRVVGYAQERVTDGERHAERAAALLARLGASPQREGQLARSRALALWWNGHYEDARSAALAAIDAYIKVAPRGVDVARALHMLAIVQQELRDFSGSIATEERAREIAIPALGAEHPIVAQMWNTSGGSLRSHGDRAQAVAHLSRALDIIAGNEGADSSASGAARMNLALVYLDDKRPTEAIPPLERARAAFERAYGAEHSRVADLLDNLGAAYSQSGRDADATATLRRAIAIHTARVGRDAPATASSWKQLGYHELRMHRARDARDAFREAVRAIDASQGNASSLVVRPLVGLGDAERALGQRAAAAAAYTRALALVPAGEADDRAEIADRLTAVRSP